MSAATKAKRSLAASKANWTRQLRKAYPDGGPLLARASTAQIESAFAACRSLRFAVTNASRFGGEFSLNDILAADRLAREALQPPPMTKAFIAYGARLILKKYRAQKGAKKKGGAA